MHEVLFIKQKLRQNQAYNQIKCLKKDWKFELNEEEILKCVNTKSEKLDLECKFVLGRYANDKFKVLKWCYICNSISLTSSKQKECIKCNPSQFTGKSTLIDIIEVLKHKDCCQYSKIFQDQIMFRLKELLRRCHDCNMHMQSSDLNSQRHCRCEKLPSN